jgi:predicted nuclease of predicted toxin-antitoxin system
VPLRIKVDEDLPSQIAERLRGVGHDVETVRGQGLGGAKDARVWHAVQADGRFLVTADKGLADIRKYSPGTHGGVLLLRPGEDGIKPLMDLMERVLRSGELDRLRGTVIVATAYALRIRRTA